MVPGEPEEQALGETPVQYLGRSVTSSDCAKTRWKNLYLGLNFLPPLDALTSRVEMVLFHCTFVTLKADSPRLVNMDPDEYKLRHEELLFKA